jgi:hypothetical protein
MTATDGRAPNDGKRHLAALLARLDSFLVRRPVLALVLPFPLFLAAGFALTAIGTSTWDTVAHHHHQLWLIGRWLGEERPLVGGRDAGFAHMTLIGTLWEYVLAAACAVFGFLKDPLWVRHAVTFTLLPLTLLTTYQLLRRAGETAGTAILAVALVAGNVRFLGHAILNVKDFPLACGYLLVTLLMWTIFRERIVSAAGLVERPGWLALLVLLSVVPYLLRVPVLQHWLLLTLLCLWVAAAPGRAGWVRRGAVAALPLLLGPLVVIVAVPGLWDTGLVGLVRSLTLFSKYPWQGPVRLFGLEFLSTELPWWYAPAWIAVAWVPIGLLTLVSGLVLFLPRLWRELRDERPWPMQPFFASLAAWVALFGGLPWAAFLLLRPTFYDEDRHLLFAMPLLGVAAALGLGRVSGRVKGALALLILGSAAWSAASWGPYAYVYKNPTLPRTSGDDFMGDYWGVSTGALAQAIYDHVPDHGYVFMIGPGPALTRELQRRETSLVVRAPERRTFDLRQRARRKGQMYVAAINRNQLCRPLLEDVARGRARELWRAEMPGGDVAALLVYYEGRCEDCPERLRSGTYGPVDFKAVGGR